jgi:hypothetical protein
MSRTKRVSAYQLVGDLADEYMAANGLQYQGIWFNVVRRIGSKRDGVVNFGTAREARAAAVQLAKELIAKRAAQEQRDLSAMPAVAMAVTAAVQLALF